MGEFLSQKLKLTLSPEKTLITHATDEKARFLGYEIKATRDGNLIARDGRRATNGLTHSSDASVGGRQVSGRFCKGGKPIHRPDLLADTDYTIIQRYQSVLRGVYNYYCMAVNVSRRMSRIKWILRTSLLKTLASKLQVQGVGNPQEVSGGPPRFRGRPAEGTPCRRRTARKRPPGSGLRRYPIHEDTRWEGNGRLRLREGMVRSRQEKVGSRATPVGREMRTVRGGRDSSGSPSHPQARRHRPTGATTKGYLGEDHVGSEEKDAGSLYEMSR